MRIALSKIFKKPFRLILISIVTFLSALGPADSSAHGQECKKAIRDYRDERIFNYQPQDPWYRGKLFNIHTKHYGRFYNCDNQEDKRNSPYIHWKPHYENDFPPRIGFRENLRRDIAEIKQRISDGSGGCSASCSCWKGRQHSTPASCPCAQCSDPNSCPSLTDQPIDNYLQAKIPTSRSRQPQHHSTLVENYGERKYGLLSGKIFQPTELKQTDSVAAKQSGKVETVAKLLQQDPDSDTKQIKSRSLVATPSNVPDALSSPKPYWRIKPPSSSTPKVVKRPELWTRYK